MNVYLDYSATTPLDGEVLEKMRPFLCERFGNPHSLHSFGRNADYAVSCARDEVARVLGVKSNEVYFTSGGTEANHWAVRSVSLALQKGIAVSAIEHHATLGAAEHVRGILPVSTVSVNSAGMVAGEALQNALIPDTGLVCVMAVNNETGVVQPIAELAERCHERGAYLFADCVQAACTQNLKELANGCDALSLSAHKFYGPKGVGVLVLKEGVPCLPYVRGGEQERRLRGGTLNVAGIVGLAYALQKAQAEREQFCKRMEALKTRFEQTVLSALPNRIRVDGAEAERIATVSHLTVLGEGGQSLLHRLDLEGVAVSAGAACSAHTALPSHVLLAMGRTEQEAKSGLRFSFGRQTTEEEVDYAAQTLIDILRKNA